MTGHQERETMQIWMSHDPDFFGCVVSDDDHHIQHLPVFDCPVQSLTEFEPASKMQDADSAALVRRLAIAIHEQQTIEPILVRATASGHQVIDGHHRFWAHRFLGRQHIPARLIPSELITDVQHESDIPVPA